MYHTILKQSNQQVIATISEELYMDKLATTNLLLKFYMIQSQKKNQRCN